MPLLGTPKLRSDLLWTTYAPKILNRSAPMTLTSFVDYSTRIDSNLARSPTVSPSFDSHGAFWSRRDYRRRRYLFDSFSAAQLLLAGLWE